MAEEIEICANVNKCMSSPQSYATTNGSSWSYRTPTNKEVAAKALAALEAARKMDVEAHERNESKLEANKALRDRIIAVMTEAGIPASYSEKDVKSRARFPKSIRKDAGYLEDLRRSVKTSDSFDYATSTYERLKASYDEFAKKADAEDQQARASIERAAAAKLEERRKNLKLVEIILRYQLPETSEWGDILGSLREKDQRLDLAVAMTQTRGDWSSGYYRVSDALNRFEVKTPQDAEIQSDILSCFNDDIDGRVFRDTAWNYTRLFAEAADQQLSADVQTAMANAGDDQ